MTTVQRQRLPEWMVGTGIIAVSMGVMNVATYAFTLVTARLLGPREYGALAALMGLTLVLNVASLGLQATAARRVSTAGGHVAKTEYDVVRASYVAASTLGILTLLATPLVAVFLRLDSWLPAALLAVALVPLTVMGAQAGLLQGERRWLGLAGIYLAVGLGRLVFGLGAIMVRPDVTGAMIGVAVGGLCPAALGWWLLRRPDRTLELAPVEEPTDGAPMRSVLREVAHNSHTLLAFFALSTADVIIARSTLDGHQAGLYAGGLILSKAVLFLPQFVVVLLFPAMARSGGQRRVQDLGLAIIATIGLVATLGAFLLPDIAVAFVGGADYVEVERRIWAFAAIGTLTAMIQLLVYGTVARQHRHAVWVLWTGVAVLVALGLTIGSSIDALLVAVAATDTVVLLVLVALSWRSKGEARPVGQ
ncbi:MAG: lipopolysaccharide biosynthesis protein [Nocardioides sp.]